LNVSSRGGSEAKGEHAGAEEHRKDYRVNAQFVRVLTGSGMVNDACFN
jgi:hypothetical protein